MKDTAYRIELKTRCGDRLGKGRPSGKDRAVIKVEGKDENSEKPRKEANENMDACSSSREAGLLIISYTLILAQRLNFDSIDA